MIFSKNSDIKFDYIGIKRNVELKIKNKQWFYDIDINSTIEKKKKMHACACESVLYKNTIKCIN